MNISRKFDTSSHRVAGGVVSFIWSKEVATVSAHMLLSRQWWLNTNFRPVTFRIKSLSWQGAHILTVAKECRQCVIGFQQFGKADKHGHPHHGPCEWVAPRRLTATRFREQARLMHGGGVIEMIEREHRSDGKKNRKKKNIEMIDYGDKDEM
ncbi:hypothetical protein M011DRAFT_523319 [Sporormia fimetaria CBS 119925]|uniref:Uncharacterized protein n=1 Tax=Sporormia fimetaria CBS 119925 TaxID=1340428 RepID=A0A6A6VL31_9PLEO|nr:hypothetical protein M011DRAFT_523319 [Sporormia fimetaria CBS 119925]